MSEAFRVDLIGLPGFVKAMNTAPATLGKELVIAGKRISLRGQALAKIYVPRDTGHLANTIYGDAVPSGIGVVATFGASAEYAIYVEKGRRPGAPMPPQGVLLSWMASHGIPESSEFVVRRAIGKRGIKARPFVTKAFAEMKGDGFITREFQAAITRTIGKIGSSA